MPLLVPCALYVQLGPTYMELEDKTHLPKQFSIVVPLLYDVCYEVYLYDVCYDVYMTYVCYEVIQLLSNTKRSSVGSQFIKCYLKCKTGKLLYISILYCQL